MIQLNRKYIDLYSKQYRINDSKYYKSLFNSLKPYYPVSPSKYTVTKAPVRININNNPFLSTSIRNKIFQLKNKHIVKSKYYTLNIYHNRDISNFIELVTIYLDFMYNLSSSKQHVQINYYLTDCKKKYTNRVLTNNNVNSGSSRPGEITIWRSEEVLKTTIHECIHQMNLDYRMDASDIIVHFKSRYNLNIDTLNTFEAYTDMWAILINVFLTTVIMKKPYRFFVEMLNLERLHILNLAQKIMNNQKRYDERTNVISYYIIKAELFQNLPKTLKFLNNHIKIKDLGGYFYFLKTLPQLKPSKIIPTDTMRMSITEII